MSEPINETFAKTKDDFAERLSRGKQTATEAIHDARDGLKEKASAYISEATEALGDRAEGVQQDISAQLSSLAGAMRAASEHLANNSQRNGSKFVPNAATGVERLSASLKTKPFSEVVDEVRSFGRDNSTALIAGSVLAGLALGRILKSSPPQDSNAEASASSSPVTEESEFSEFKAEMGNE